VAPQSPPADAPPPLPRPTDEAEWNDRLTYWRQYIADSIAQTSASKIAFGLFGGLVAVVLTFIALRPSGTGPPLEEALPLLDPANVSLAPQAPAQAEPETLVVHVAGAVTRPGLVELDIGSRVADAIAEAGGPTTDADLNRINLASPLSDADRVYVPLEGEAVEPLDSLVEASSTEVGPLDLNRATAADLEALPGVGPATAGAIIAYRDANGSFASIAALENVPGIGPAKMSRLRELVTVDP